MAFFIFVISFFFIVLALRSFLNSSSYNFGRRTEGQKNIGSYFKLRDYFFTHTEKPFYEELLRQTEGSYYVLSKVRLEDIVTTAKKLDYKEKITFKKILKENNILFKDDFFQGIDLINIEIEPNSGFFIIINVTKIIGKKYKDFLISDYRSLLKFLYTSVNIKILTGNAFCWPDKKEFVIRGTIALSYEDLLEGYLRFKMAINLLK